MSKVSRNVFAPPRSGFCCICRFWSSLSSNITGCSEIASSSLTLASGTPPWDFLRFDRIIGNASVVSGWKFHRFRFDAGDQVSTVALCLWFLLRPRSRRFSEYLRFQSKSERAAYQRGLEDLLHIVFWPLASRQRGILGAIWSGFWLPGTFCTGDEVAIFDPECKDTRTLWVSWDLVGNHRPPSAS